MNNRIKVAAYARVSTDFEDQLNSLATQISYFTEYIEDHEDWELVEVYYDEGITGTSTQKREGFNRMISDCEAGKINTILTKEVSRFARNTVDTLNFTRQLSQLKVNVIFLNDGIDTNDKDGELRLTIMASLAQEESRKMSERIKWGLKRRMEKGVVIGKKTYFGYRVIDGKLVIEPNEAEIVKRIFHEYVFEHKGSTSIARGLNDDKIPTNRGNAWASQTVITMLRNDKYVGDLTAWKICTTDYLTKRKVKNNGENPEMPVITIKDHHEPIISREVWDAAQAEITKRGAYNKGCRRYSGTFWFSGRVICGVCGKTFTVCGGKKVKTRSLRCVNRVYYGKDQLNTANNKTVGCGNKTIRETCLVSVVKYILKQIQVSREEIENELLAEVAAIQGICEPVDIEVCKKDIENYKAKKRNAIDLMLDGLISKDDLSEQNTFYDEKIAELTKKINDFNNVDSINNKQIEDIKKYIEMVKGSAGLDIDDTELYREIVKTIIVQNNRTLDVFLNFIPFGFRVKFTLKKTGVGIPYSVIIESCEPLS